MKPSRWMICTALTGSLVLAPITGCESLPGGKKEQGAVIGGLAGAGAGAALSKDNRLLGALLGGALGAGGGYLIGMQLEKSNDEDGRDQAIKASNRAESDPATAADVRNARTADLNNDGFVTLDEVVAMQKAGLSDAEMIRRLEATGQFFALTQEQEQYLLDRNVDREVVVSMRTLNQDVRREAQRRIGSDRISAPAP